MSDLSIRISNIMAELSFSSQDSREPIKEEKEEKQPIQDKGRIKKPEQQAEVKQIESKEQLGIFQGLSEQDLDRLLQAKQSIDVLFVGRKRETDNNPQQERVVIRQQPANNQPSTENYSLESRMKLIKEEIERDDRLKNQIIDILNKKDFKSRINKLEQLPNYLKLKQGFEYEQPLIEIILKIILKLFRKLDSNDNEETIKQLMEQIINTVVTSLEILFKKQLISNSNLFFLKITLIDFLLSKIIELNRGLKAKINNLYIIGRQQSINLLDPKNQVLTFEHYYRHIATLDNGILVLSKTIIPSEEEMELPLKTKSKIMFYNTQTREFEERSVSDTIFDGKVIRFEEGQLIYVNFDGIKIVYDIETKKFSIVDADNNIEKIIGNIFFLNNSLIKFNEQTGKTEILVKNLDERPKKARREGYLELKRNGLYNLFDLKNGKLVFDEFFNEIEYLDDEFYIRLTTPDNIQVVYSFKSKSFVITKEMGFVNIDLVSKYNNQYYFYGQQPDNKYSLIKFNEQTGKTEILLEGLDEGPREAIKVDYLVVKRNGLYNLFDLKTEKLISDEFYKETKHDNNYNVYLTTSDNIQVVYSFKSKSFVITKEMCFVFADLIKEHNKQYYFYGQQPDNKYSLIKFNEQTGKTEILVEGLDERPKKARREGYLEIKQNGLVVIFNLKLNKIDQIRSLCYFIRLYPFLGYFLVIFLKFFGEYAIDEYKEYTREYTRVPLANSISHLDDDKEIREINVAAIRYLGFCNGYDCFSGKKPDDKYVLIRSKSGLEQAQVILSDLDEEPKKAEIEGYLEIKQNGLYNLFDLETGELISVEFYKEIEYLDDKIYIRLTTPDNIQVVYNFKSKSFVITREDGFDYDDWSSR